MRTLEQASPASAVIVGAGYIGLEMADALTTRGLAVTQIEQLPEVLPTVDPPLGALVHAELSGRGVQVLTGTTVRAVRKAAPGEGGRLRVEAVTADGEPVTRHADLVLVVVGVRPDTELAKAAGAELGARGAISVDSMMRTGLPDIYAAGEAAARTGLRDHEAEAAGYDPVTVGSEADDHKAYYPGSHRIHMLFTGDRSTGQLLGVQLFGHRHAEIAKRIDIAATAIFHRMTADAVSDLDLSYTPPLGSPWDAVQTGAQAWVRHARQP